MALLEINGVKFNPVEGADYLTDWPEIARYIKSHPRDADSVYRHLAQTDTWFVVYFVLTVPIANHPHWVSCCKDLDTGPKTNTLDLWAREHGKSTVITVAETIKDILANPEIRCCIFSYKKTASMAFLRQIKQAFEASLFLKRLFPDVLYENPMSESHKWSELDGIYVKRKGNYKEATVYAAGLLEGMPTGSHFTKRIYDDIMTEDVANSPEQIQKLKEMFDLSQNLGTIDGNHRVIGTPYHHEDVLQYVRDKKDSDENYIYHTRLKPATEGGKPNGKSVYLPEKRIAELRANRRLFFSQQLLDPTPVGTELLDANRLEVVSPGQIPENLYRFMTIDPAGDQANSNGKDSWAMHVVGVEPYMDDIGASTIYLLDSIIEPMTLEEATNNAVKLYLRGGRILKLGIERSGLGLVESHICAALRARGKYVSIESGTLEVLKPAGRSKQYRIESALMWPLQNGKIKIASTVPACYQARLKLEMQKFPFWHDDGLDSLAYVADILKNYRFGFRGSQSPIDIKDRYDKVFNRDFSKDSLEKLKKGTHGWLVV